MERIGLKFQTLTLRPTVLPDGVKMVSILNVRSLEIPFMVTSPLVYVGLTVLKLTSTTSRGVGLFTKLMGEDCPLVPITLNLIAKITVESGKFTPFSVLSFHE